jgi:hypothetical protein
MFDIGLIIFGIIVGAGGATAFFMFRKQILPKPKPAAYEALFKIKTLLKGAALSSLGTQIIDAVEKGIKESLYEEHGRNNDKPENPKGSDKS